MQKTNNITVITPDESMRRAQHAMHTALGALLCAQAHMRDAGVYPLAEELEPVRAAVSGIGLDLMSTRRDARQGVK